MSDYFADLPATERAALAAVGRRYSPFIPGANPDEPIPDRETFLQILQWQKLETEILDAHIEWFNQSRTAMQQAGLEWTRQNLTDYVKENDR